MASRQASKKSAKKTLPKRGAKSASATEQRKIEKLLGEEFDSLAQARRALKRETVKPTKAEVKRLGKKQSAPIPERKRKPKPLPVKNSYTIRELTHTERKTFLAYVHDVESKSNEEWKQELNLKPGEMFGAVFTGKDGLDTRTVSIYSSLPRMMQTLGKYFSQITGKKLSDLLSDLKVIKFNRDAAAKPWHELVKEGRTKRKEYKKEQNQLKREGRKVPRLKRKIAEETERRKAAERELKAIKKRRK